MTRLIKLLPLLFLTTISFNAYAWWPQFVAPDVDYLIQHHYIQTKGCPKGQGKLTSSVNVSVLDFCFDRFCPPEWMWHGIGDNTCHDLKQGFTFQRYATVRYRGSDGTTSYSDVHAHYVDTKTGQQSISFKFTSPKEHWACYDFPNSDTGYISCANDI